MVDIRCSNCGKKRDYSDKYDAYYRSTCDLWLEKACGDPSCDFCGKRPEKPSHDTN